MQVHERLAVYRSLAACYALAWAQACMAVTSLASRSRGASLMASDSQLNFIQISSTLAPHMRATFRRKPTPLRVTAAAPRRRCATRMEPNTGAALDRAAEVIRAADAIMFTSGAGLGVDSGLPDFRGQEGFWRAYPPMKHLNLRFEEMSNPQWFKRDPALAWGFWGHRCDLYRTTNPHAGFQIMKAFGEEKEKTGLGYFVVTSNVDGQFLKAGFPEQKIIEIHGSSQWMQCTDPECEAGIWAATDLKVKFDPTTFRAEEPYPKCIKCDNLARPNVLMFGDYGWLDDRHTGQEIEWDKWRGRLTPETKVAIIEIGAGSHVPTIRILGHSLAKSSKFKGTLIRINPGEPEVPAGNISLPMGGLAALKGIQERLAQK